MSYLALDKSSNNTSNSFRFCRTPVGPPGPGDDTAAEDILLPTGENCFELDGKFGLLLADVLLFDSAKFVWSVTTAFGDRCDVLL
jgi:hypothetical protein